MFTILPSFGDDSFLMPSISYKSSDPNKSLHVSSKPGMFVCVFVSFPLARFQMNLPPYLKSKYIVHAYFILFVHTMNKWAAWPHILLIALELRESAATFILFPSIEKGDDMLTAIFLGSKNFKDDEMFYIKTRPPLLPIANSCHLIKIAFFIHSTIHCYLSSCIQGLWRKMHTKGGAPPPLMRHVWAF